MSWVPYLVPLLFYALFYAAIIGMALVLRKLSKDVEEIKKAVHSLEEHMKQDR
ncbi:MAG: hypothetical protein ABSD56_12530 [Bryobacteraceae bacterium]